VSLTNLAMLYKSQGRLAESEPFNERVLTNGKIAAGDERLHKPRSRAPVFLEGRR